MKFELTDETREYLGKTLYRIRALRDIPSKNVEEGDLGGFVESEDNLSQEGDAWVSGDAEVCGDAWVCGDAEVCGDARVCGDAEVCEQHRINFGYVNEDLTESVEKSLRNQLGVVPDEDGKILLCKKVKKVKDGKYRSNYDPDFMYADGEIAKVENPDHSNTSCSTGIHVAHYGYWSEGDTWIRVKVDIDDIITIQEGKARCEKVKVLGEVDNDGE